MTLVSLVPFFIVPPYPISFCTGWVFCSFLLSLAGLLPGDTTDCSTAPQTEWVCVSHSYPALASPSWYFPSAWPGPPQYLLCPPKLSAGTCYGALPVVCSLNTSLTHANKSPLMTWKLSQVNFTLTMSKPSAGDPRPADMHLSLKRSYQDHEICELNIVFT